MPEPSPALEPLASLKEKLDLLMEQIDAYERALPGNPSVRAALGHLRRLTRQLQGEMRSLEETLTPSETTAHPFTARESEVLALAARGLTNKEVAYRLGISERTVQFHMKSIFQKTGTNSRTEAVTEAIKQGWLTV